MRKIPTVFLRDPENMKHVLPEVNPGCEWVLDGEGVATRKFDGTCVMFDGIVWCARREVKAGGNAPDSFVAIETDPVTNKTVGWMLMAESSFAKFLDEALEKSGAEFAPGTYELVGPKINGNPERYEHHTLIRHAEADVLLCPDRSYEGIRSVVVDMNTWDACEGIVFHHEDGRMAKIKARDFPKPTR